MNPARLCQMLVIPVLLCAVPMSAEAQPRRHQAQAPPPKKPDPIQAGNRGQPTPEEFQEAQRRYEEAITLFNEGSYEAALLEFRRAYELAPTYRILYNVALVNVQVNDYAEALTYFERYLDEGGPDIPAERVEEVRQRMAALRPRVAHISVTTNVTSGQLVINDFTVAELPLEKPVRVNAGRVKITVNSTGKLPVTKVVELAGGDTKTVSFELRDPTVTVLPPPGGRHERPPKSIPWVAWVGTGVLAVGAGVTGFLAYRANSDLKEKKDTFGTADTDLEADYDRQRRFAIAADVLTVSAVALGGVALYLTLSEPSADDKPENRQTMKLRLSASPGAVFLGGSF
jgi:hypothetical protein